LQDRNPGQMTVSFSCLLSFCSTIVLLGIVAIHRATEDPFVWPYPGNSVDVSMELNDLLEKLIILYKAHGKEKLVRRST
jgi:hypothetical protein